MNQFVVKMKPTYCELTIFQLKKISKGREDWVIGLGGAEEILVWPGF